MTIRLRILTAIVAPAIALLVVFSLLVYTRVKTDRLNDLDGSLRAKAAALAALVERDEDGRWETEPLAPVAGAETQFDVQVWPSGARIGASMNNLPPAVRDVEGLQVQWPREDDEGEPLPMLMDGHVDASEASSAGAGARSFVGVYLVRAEATEEDDGHGDEDDGARKVSGAAPLVRVVVSTSTAPIDADLAALTKTLVFAGALLALIALVVGAWLSRRIVAPLARMATAAEAMREPSAAAPITARDVDLDGNDEVARLGRSLNDAFARMYDAYERQRRFASDASHELRTPIAVVRTEAEVTLRAPRTVDEYRASLHTVLEGTARMQRTVEGLLLLARADRRALESSMSDVDMLEVARSVSRDATGVNATVRGHAEHLRVLVSNLVENAKRHARSTVEVTIASRAGDNVELRVADDGPGIPAELRERVFERFFRVDSARSSDQGGAGLGLSIVRTIAELHGGRAHVEENPTGGAVFVVTLPAKRESRSSASLQTASVL